MSKENSLLLKNVRCLDSKHRNGLSELCDVAVVNGYIDEIRADISEVSFAEVFDVKGNLLAPGLVNAHFHSSVNHMKGFLPSLPLEIFMLYECPELDILKPTPREAYLRTMLGCIEMIRTGTTSVQDDCFFVPHPSTELIDSVASAYKDSGMRVRLALDQQELSELEKLPFLAEILPEDAKTRLSQKAAFSGDQVLEMYQHLIEKWHGAENGRIKAAVSCSAPQRVTPKYFASLEELSQKYDLPFYVHMLETKLQRVFGVECLNNRSLVEYTNDLGLISDRMNIIHAIWVTDDDLQIIAKNNATIAHNPISNLRLGSGIMKWREIHDLGINVCLGVDECIADDSINMWNVMKIASIVHNITENNYDKWPKVEEVFQAGTYGGGLAMREKNLGQVRVGAPADLLIINLENYPFVPLNNITRQLVSCELGSSVLTTIIAGKVVAKDGVITTVDEVALLAEIKELFSWKNAKLTQAAESVRDIIPHYRKMYDRSMAYNIGFERKLS
ncbi:MAG: amidohydrolase family protein [Paracoccaceae bacterium]|jgi:5-methylthioadenosine/S-adenosylhomocysteine deaminase